MELTFNGGKRQIVREREHASDNDKCSEEKK